MKILADTSSTIQKHTDTLSRAFPRKAGNDSLSSKTLRKFAFIANRDFKCTGYDLGAAFTGRTVPAPPEDNAYAKLQLAELRYVISTQRLQLRAGTCLHDYLGDVLKRLPQSQLSALEKWRQSPCPSPISSRTPQADTPRVEPKPDYVMDGADVGQANRNTTYSAPYVKEVPIDYGTVSLRSALRPAISTLVDSRSVEFGLAYMRTFEDVNPELRTSDPVLGGKALERKLENDMRDEMMEPVDEALEASLRVAETAAAQMGAASST